MKNVLVTPTKSITFNQYPEESWRLLAGDQEGEDAASPKTYFRAVAWLYRGVEIRAQAVSSMPFALYRGETEYDTSKDWQNKVGFIPNPRELLWLLEACLTLEPMAYLFSDNVGRMRKQLRYILPNGADPVIDPLKGLTAFRRSVQGVQRDFKPEIDIIYFWRPDPYTEQGAGPGKSSPGKAALMAAGVLANVDEFVSKYFASGAVKATLLAVKGDPLPEERERLEKWWTAFMSGVKNAFRGKVVNADSVTATILGEGLESLSDKNLTAERREDIATALGVPHSLLFSDAANFATAQQDDLHFYTKTIVPECEFIAGVLNEQVFAPLGLALKFLPDTLDAFQEDEKERAGALSQLTSAGIPLLMAMDILGFELTKEQRAELEKAAAEKEKRDEEMREVEIQQMQQPARSENPRQDEALRKWRTKALKRFKEGEKGVVDFTSEDIPTEMHDDILAKLGEAKTIDDIQAAFRPAAVPMPVDWATELKRANDLLERAYAA